MPAISIEQLYPNFDTLAPIEQIATLAAGVQSYAKEIIRAMELAQTIASANEIAALIAATEDGAGVGGSAVLGKAHAELIMRMQQWFLAEIDAPLTEGGLSPRQVLYRRWPAPTPPV